MTRVDDYLNLVDDPSRRRLTPGHPADDALIALLAHVAFSDGVVDDQELGFLQRVLPDRDRAALKTWAISAGSQPLSLEAVARALPTVEERWKGLFFASRMAWKDGEVQPQERTLLDRLADALELPEGAVDRVLDTLQGRAHGRLHRDRILNELERFKWDAVQLAGGNLASDLVEVVPDGLVPVARIGLDKVEVAAIFEEGVAGRFLEGNAFLRWDDLVTYTRVPVLGASVQFHTESGRTWTLVDHRMRGLGTLVDRLFREDREERERGPVEGLTPLHRDDEDA